jgi:hypothetical protein
MTIPIERGIPLPPKRPKAEEIVPELAWMKLGDSIYIPNQPGRRDPPVLGMDVCLYGLENDKEFTTEYDEEGLRVWRTA